MVADRGQHPADAQGADAQDVAHDGDPGRYRGLRLRRMLRRNARLAIQQVQAHGRSGLGSGAHRRNVYTTPKTNTNQDDADAGIWRHGSIQYATLDEDDEIRKEVIIMARKVTKSQKDKNNRRAATYARKRAQKLFLRRRKK